MLIDSNLFQSFGDLDHIPLGMFTNTNISNITIPDTIERIDNEAFFACVNLSTIEISSSVKLIGSNAFKNTGLTEIKLNEGLEEIYSSVFTATKIEHITLPTSIRILEYPFEYSNIKSIEFLGSSVERLMLGVETRTEITIPRNADELE